MKHSLVRRILLALSSALLAGAPAVASAQLFGPSTYEDCILKNMQGVTGNLAATSVLDACRKKFPVPTVQFPEFGNKLPVEVGIPPGISFPDEKNAAWGNSRCLYKNSYAIRYEADTNAMPFLSSVGSPAFGSSCIDQEDVGASKYVASRLRRTLDLVKLLRIEGAYRPGAPSARNIVVQNGSPIALSSLRLGITIRPGQPCSLNSADYRQVYWCDGYVDAHASGSFSCSDVPDDPRLYCALGYKAHGHKSMLGWNAAVAGM